MKFTCSVTIQKPLQEVADYFANPAYLGEYQESFQKKELVSGEMGQEGAISKIFYADGKRKMELTETILKNDLPNEFIGQYHHKHMDNTMKCKFIALDDNHTRYEYEYEYTRIDWVMPRLMSILFPGMYKKPAQKWLRQFKEFVEKQ